MIDITDKPTQFEIEGIIHKEEISVYGSKIINRKIKGKKWLMLYESKPIMFLRKGSRKFIPVFFDIKEFNNSRNGILIYINQPEEKEK